MKKPVVDFAQCVACDICSEGCPSVFHRGEDGTVEVVCLAAYPEKEVNAVMKRCLGNCITWKDSIP